MISIHAPRTGSDTIPFRPRRNKRISIHAPRTGSDHTVAVEHHVGDISIHAPRTGSDCQFEQHFLNRKHFNPRSPHGERLPLFIFGSWALCYFNPRSPHGERLFRTQFPHWSPDFNPRSPHGERRRGAETRFTCKAISIHAPRTGSDQARGCASQFPTYFNPRSPHGERR